MALPILPSLQSVVNSITKPTVTPTATTPTWNSGGGNVSTVFNAPKPTVAPAASPTTIKPVTTPIATGPTYQNILQNRFGGNAQAYAEAIKKNTLSGTLSNPQAAAQFQAANPQLFATSTAAPQGNNAGVRQYLNSLGFMDNQIGWNANTGMVTVNGIDVLRPVSNVAGTAFAPVQAIMQALQAAGIQQAPQQNMDDIYKRVLDILNGPQPGMDNINTAEGIVNKGPYQFDPATDPTAAALSKYLSQKAIEMLNNNGVMGASFAPEAIAQAIAPSLLQLAALGSDNYNANISNLLNISGAEQNQGQNLIANLMGLGGAYERQDESAYTREQNDMTNYINMLKMQIEQEQANADRQVDYDKTALEYSGMTAAQKAEYDLAVKNYGLDVANSMWDRSPDNPSNRPDATDYKDTPEYQQAIALYAKNMLAAPKGVPINGKMVPKSSLEWLTMNADAIISKIGVDGFKELLAMINGQSLITNRESSGGDGTFTEEDAAAHK